MEGFIEVASITEIEPGTMREVEVEDHKLLVARVEDEFYITDGRCAHMGAPLAKGVLEGTVVTCPWHHSQYDLTDGSCLRWTDWKGTVLSVAELVRHPRPIRAYEAKVESGKLYMGPQKPLGRVPE